MTEERKDLTVIDATEGINLPEVTAKRITNIVSRQNTEVGFTAIDDKALAKIEANMPAIYRATNAFGRTNSQISRKFKTLPMNSYTPYRWMRQCLAEIEGRRMALKENRYELKKKRNEHDILIKKFDEAEDEFERRSIAIEIENIEMNIADARIYYEGALKELGVFIDTYNEIRESQGIPEDWDEADFEEEEIKEQIHMAFNLLIDDCQCHGRIGKGTIEQLRNFGINPVVAERLVQQYLRSVNDAIQEDRLPDISTLYNFLDRMYEIFKDEYKKVMKRVGIKNLISEDYLYRTDK